MRKGTHFAPPLRSPRHRIVVACRMRAQTERSLRCVAAALHWIAAVAAAHSASAPWRCDCSGETRYLRPAAAIAVIPPLFDQKRPSVDASAPATWVRQRYPVPQRRAVARDDHAPLRCAAVHAACALRAWYHRENMRSSQRDARGASNHGAAPSPSNLQCTLLNPVCRRRATCERRIAGAPSCDVRARQGSDRRLTMGGETIPVRSIAPWKNVRCVIAPGAGSAPGAVQ